MNVIAIDFDGTLAETEFPTIKKIFVEGIKTANILHEKGVEVIIWTARDSNSLADAKNKLHELGLNKDIKFNEHSDFYKSHYEVDSPKIGADLYIDDRALGAPNFSDETWKEIRNNLLKALDK